MRADVLPPDAAKRPAQKGPDAYHVLMIAPTSFFASYGCHVRILEEARILQRMGHRVTIATYHNGQDVAGLDIERTLPIPWRSDYEVGSSRHKIGFDVLLGIKCATFTWRRPDVIHAHLHEGVLIGYPLGLLWGVPLVFDFQGSMTSEMLDHRFLNRGGILFKPWRRLERLLTSLPKAIITSSHNAAQLLTESFECDPAIVTPIPDCVNADTFSPSLSPEEVAELKSRWEIPPSRRVVAYLGLLAEHQGTSLLLEAAASIIKRRPDTHFLIMGYPGVEHYRVLAQRLGLGDHVTFTGRVAYPDDAARYLSMGDVAVAPKISATEGSGKLLNYMAMAMPVVAFDTPVSREYLGTDGVYASCGDVAELAEALCTLLDDPVRARQLGENLRRRSIAKYSWEWAGRQIVRIYDEVRGQSQRDHS